MRPVSKSLKEYGRGIIGGLLFSLPLLFTMEVWWAGYSVDYYSLIAYILFTFLLLLGYNRFAGMRKDASFKEVVVDSIEEIGLGLVFSIIILWVIGRVVFTEMSINEIVGKVIIEAMTVAIGISVGTAQLGTDKEEKEQDKGMDGDEERDVSRSTGGLAVLSVCGGVLIGGNLAPTEEIVMIALEINAFQALLLVLSSLLIVALILFFTEFKGTRISAGSGSGTGLKEVVVNTSFIYMIAFVTSFLILFFFGRFEGNGFSASVFEIIVLGFPTALGASAGRLLIK